MKPGQLAERVVDLRLISAAERCGLIEASVSWMVVHRQLNPISAAERCGLIEASMMERTNSFELLSISAAERCGLIEALFVNVAWIFYATGFPQQNAAASLKLFARTLMLQGATSDFRSRTLRPH